MCLPLVVWLTSLDIGAKRREKNAEAFALDRVFFVVVMLSLSFAAYRVLLSRNSPAIATKKADSVAMRLFHIWLLLVTVVPALLAIVAIIGYHYTVHQLAIRLLETAGFVLHACDCRRVGETLILVNRRRLARSRPSKSGPKPWDWRRPRVWVMKWRRRLPQSSWKIRSIWQRGEQTAKLLSTILVAVGLVLAWFVWRDMSLVLTFGHMTVVPEADPETSLRWGQLLKFLLVLAVTYIATVKSLR